MATSERVLTHRSADDEGVGVAHIRSHSMPLHPPPLPEAPPYTGPPSSCLSDLSVLKTGLLIGSSSVLLGHEGSVGGGRALLDVLLDHVGTLDRRDSPVVLLGKEAKVHEACGRLAVARVVLTRVDVLAESAA